MWIVSVALAFCLGILTGYQLPSWLDAWRAYRYRKTFKLNVLKQYTPVSGRRAGNGKQDKADL